MNNIPREIARENRAATCKTCGRSKCVCAKIALTREERQIVAMLEEEERRLDKRARAAENNRDGMMWAGPILWTEGVRKQIQRGDHRIIEIGD